MLASTDSASCFFRTDGIKAASGEPGLKFSVDFGMGMLNALNLGDVLNELVYQVRPFEVNKGETDRVIQESVKTLTDTLRDRKRWHILEAAPKWAKPYIEKNKKIEGIGCTLGKIAHNLYGKGSCVHTCRDSINAIEVDRLRVKPVVKITGEFWAQTTEGDGNFNMFAFLEKEDAGPGGTNRHLDRLHDARGEGRCQSSCECRSSLSRSQVV